ncbi:MAG: acyl-CoA dehydrogenase family protein [Myxococcales bacterium]|nr:acyl-CoA dehydrogenase family protein [Myxococcales bacterium]
MDLALTPAQAAARDTARRLAQELLAPHARTFDAEHTFPTAHLQALARAGLFGVNIRPEHGGLGAGAVAYALAVRELAAACAATTVAMMVTNMVAEAIQTFGDDDQRARFLPRITSGEWPAAGFSLSEPGAGSDASSLTTRAVRDGDAYVLDGTKAWVTSGGHAGLYLVMARTNPAEKSRGISAFLVPGDAPGLTATKPEEKMGLRASATTQLVFDGCRVPAHNRLGPEGIGFRIAMSALDGGRIGVSAQAVGIATAAAAAATRHAADLMDDMPPEHADIQRRGPDCAMELDAGWLLCLRAASLKDQGRGITREAAMAKLYATDRAQEVIDKAVQLHGGDGVRKGHIVESLYREIRALRIYEGASDVQKVVIARQVMQ